MQSGYNGSRLSSCESMDEEEDILSAEEKLLLHARNGDTEKLAQVLVADGNTDFDINCKGNQKANLGYTPLHLASYFGHKSAVDLLLQHGADVNIVNDEGDTPLHRAAYTGRVEVVTELIKHNATVNRVNSEGNLPKDIARNPQVKQLIEAAGAVDQRRATKELHRLAQSGDAQKLSQLLKSVNTPPINSLDKYGNTALHIAASRGHKAVAVLLLQNGVDTNIKNSKDFTAEQIANDTQMKQLLAVKPLKELQKDVQRFEGFLLKRSKILGWKAHWTVLDKGVISFFKTRADSTTGSKRKSCRSLDDATVEAHSQLEHVFSLTCRNGAVYMLGVQPGPDATVHRQKWMNCISSHTAFCTRLKSQGQVSDDDDLEDLLPLGSLQDVLQDAIARQKLLESSVSKVTDDIGVFTNNCYGNNTIRQVPVLQIQEELSGILNVSKEMCSSLAHCVSIFQQQEEVRKLKLREAEERIRVLQDSLQVLATEHHELEQSLGGQRSPTIMSESDDEFYDCSEEGGAHYSVDGVVNVNGSKLETVHIESTVPNSTDMKDEHVTQNGANHKSLTSSQDLGLSKWNGRSRLPVKMFSRNNFSVWEILKQCIGKELSKITMPVIFNEPLSFLQRVVEYMEYAPLLQKAALCEDPVERLECISAFAISSSASNWDRVGKPFNPLLGETYELNRPDLGFKVVCEQVSHHPPVSAFHADSEHYTFHGAILPKLKFWGKSVEITPKGTITLHLKKWGETYTWHNVNCCVHNIIVGTLWIEHTGTMEITNHKTKHKAVLQFKSSGWFGKDLHKVEGNIYDSNKKKVKTIYGKWIEGIYSHDINVWDSYLKAPGKIQQETAATQNTDSDAEPCPERGSTCNLNLPGQKLLWTADPRPTYSNEYFSFTSFATMLNELKDDEIGKLPITDSRLRPDIRLLEEGNLDAAAEEKHRLEEKQRTARKERKKTKDEWQPKYFKLDIHPDTKKEDWLYNDTYWNQRHDSPDIF